MHKNVRSLDLTGNPSYMHRIPSPGFARIFSGYHEQE